MRLARSIIRIIVTSLICALCCQGLNAQLNYTYTAGKFLIKGRVTDIETHSVVSMANVRILNTHRGLTCEADGSFTMYVSKGDSLEFSSMGYVTRVYSVAAFDSSQYYTLDIELVHDFINLKEVMIYPFRDVDEFKSAFIDARGQQFLIPGIPPPKYSNKAVKSRFYNPISYLYDRLKNRSSADPNFKP